MENSQEVSETFFTYKDLQFSENDLQEVRAKVESLLHQYLKFEEIIEVLDYKYNYRPEFTKFGMFFLLN